MRLLIWWEGFVAGLQLITISDLEQDYMNPHDCADALNPWVVSRLLYTKMVQRGPPQM